MTRAPGEPPTVLSVVAGADRGGVVDIRWVSRDRGLEPAVLDDVKFLRTRDDGFVWVDIARPDGPAREILRDTFDFHPLAVGECFERIPLPKVHVYADHAFIVLNGLERGSDDQLHLLPMKHFVGPGILVTVRGPIHEAVDASASEREVQSVLTRMESGHFRPTNGVELGHAIATALARRLEVRVGELAARITVLERRVLVNSPRQSEAVLLEMFTARHELQIVRTNAAQSHEVYARLSGIRTMPPEVLPWLIDLNDQFQHLRNICDGEREYLQEVLDLYQTRVANELNRFVRFLTSWGAIGLTGTLIAGVYGMNFTHMPELDWRLGYPMALGLMLVSGLLLAWYFRRKDWL
jgi:magnesium transporter